MKKTFAVFKREYLQAVRKKMFIVMTFLLPLLMIGVFMIPTLLMEGGLGEKRVAVIDGTGELEEAFKKPEKQEKPDEDSIGKRGDLPQQLIVEYVNAKTADVEKTAKPYVSNMGGKNGFDGVFLVPHDALTSTKAKLKYYSRSATDFITQSRLSSGANRFVRERRLAARGIDRTEVENLLSDLDVEAVQISKTGEEKKGGVGNFFAGMILVALMFIPSFVYGLETMRGIIQEKTDRVVEVLVSSVSSKQLLIGKVLGIACVGLTQIGAWLVMAGAAGAFLKAGGKAAGISALAMLRPSTFFFFVLFFCLSYLTYVCIYAIGGAVCNSEKEAQQMIMPITFPMMLPWFLLAPILTNPESKLAVGLSLAPIWGPMTMYMRTLVAEPPMWHVAITVLVSLLTISALFWITAKIFRIGILSYGKRPTIAEIWKWLKVA
jgi:ABC-2 type transport system permease protein